MLVNFTAAKIWRNTVSRRVVANPYPAESGIRTVSRPLPDTVGAESGLSVLTKVTEGWARGWNPPVN